MRSYNKSKKPKHVVSTNYRDIVIFEGTVIEKTIKISKSQNSKKHSICVGGNGVVKFDRFKNIGKVVRI